MTADVWTIVWKEWKEYLLQRGGLRGGWVGLLVMVGVFGVFLPLQAGRAWVESPVTLVYWLWVPLFLVSSVVADSFAGERERHTLETLLASRLSDKAILLGKVAAAIGYGWGLTVVMILVGLVTTNVAAGGGEILLYPAPIALSMLVLSFLAAALVASVGVLVSLRASTVRQAAQSLSIGIMALLFVPLFGFQALPAELKSGLGGLLRGADLTTIALGAIAVLLALDAGLLLAARQRFQRARLILD